VPGPVAVPFVNDTRLLVRPGMEAATGNIYVGLQEFHEMAFVLHALRPDDLFVDVGANVGTYTLLAASAVGCRCIAIEPVRQTWSTLIDNVELNQARDRVETHCIAVGPTAGQARFTSSLKTCNRIATPDDEVLGHPTIDVPMRPLDAVINGRRPTVLKIDVEGYEPEVIAGAQLTLEQPDLLAVLMETNPQAAGGGEPLNTLNDEMRRLGFSPHRYDGLRRSFHRLESAPGTLTNTVYVRSLEALTERCQSSPRYRVLDTEV
jgi:FkbM family methyltransferase